MDFSSGIAVDAAHSTKNRCTEIQGIDLATGEVIFYENLGNQTINIGEFLAIVAAAKYIVAHNHKPRLIFSDSTTAITWFNEKYTASKKRNKHLQKAEIYLKSCWKYLQGIEVVHWNTQEWGENPADFGRKG